MGRRVWCGGERTPTDVWFRWKNVRIREEEVRFVIAQSLNNTSILHTSLPNISCQECLDIIPVDSARPVKAEERIHHPTVCL